MRKNGFTLIELLAVIVVLGILGLIIIPNVAGTLKNQKDNLYKVQISNIEEAAKGWASEHFFTLPTGDNEVKSIYLKDLVGFIDTDINNPKANKSFGKCLKINITKVTGAENYTYKVDESTVNNDSGCEGTIIDNPSTDPSNPSTDPKDPSNPSTDPSDPSTDNPYTDITIAGNDPNLLNNSLTPVVYDEFSKRWVVADTTKEWYNYSKQEWANAVILNSGVNKSVGDTVVVPTDTSTTSEVKAMLVWIPRYEYHIEGQHYGTHLDGTAGTQALPGQIEIKFIPKSQTTADSNYILHPAFTWDNNSDGTITSDEHISGIWVGKFETTGTGDEPTILPNVQPLTGQNISTKFATSLRLNDWLMTVGTVDSHMAKNTEWGAIAYLSQSIYGKYGNTDYTGAYKEVYYNYNNCDDNHKNYTTGKSCGTYPGGKAVLSCLYNDIAARGNGMGSCGGGASTTGNITGVYDMSGGALEVTMGYLTTASTTWGATAEDGNKAGFSKAPASKYYDFYDIEITNALDLPISKYCNGGICYGQALSETSSWYGDYAIAIYPAAPWFVRGGSVYSSRNVGVFAYHYIGYAASSNEAFRSVFLMPGA